ncbi:uncharacterized protein LOC127836262 isoform X2 [Dreissena polymorpha]|uniref:uncharacterized protein LOC127836262 isoform X2 n=1 Tax=Dreissena polymorpha TaxID=45954 RepID=UPI002264729E|nr:uncharacterized protein LOC127836262 isoform X2 [Dreissena polymorpha]
MNELKSTINIPTQMIQKAIADTIEAIKLQHPSFKIPDDLRKSVKTGLNRATGQAQLQTGPAFPVNAINAPKRNVEQSERDQNEEKLKKVRALQEVARSMDNDRQRLNEFIAQTEVTMGTIKNVGILTKNDIDDLKGCLDSWKNAKERGYYEEEEHKRQEEERRRREEEERKKRAEEERRRKEEEQQRKEKEAKKKREEEERRRKEEEVKKKREEEEQRRIAEEERKKREAEIRIRKEEEERMKREEEERRRKEEERLKQLEEQKRLDEEARKKDEEERLRLEEERKRQEVELERKRKAEEERLLLEEQRKKKLEEDRQRRLREEEERERRRKEEDDRARRLDPNNWKPFIYERSCGEVSGKRPFHDGLCCMIASPSDSIAQDSIQCTASDELDDIIEILEEDERPASSIINVHTTSHSISTECPSRVYLPHYPISSTSEELVIKYTINGSDWYTSEFVRPTQQIENNEDYDSTNLIGVEANNFDTMKLFVVSRQKSQKVIIDKAGLTVASTSDKNVRLYTPRDAFPIRTNVRLSVVNKSMDPDDSIVGSDLLSEVISVGPMITIICDKAPVKDLEVDIARPATGSGVRQRSTRHHLIMSRGRVWAPAEREYKDASNMVVSVKLPANRERYTIVEIELPSTCPKENALKLAQSYHTQIISTPVHVLLKQHEANPQNAKIEVVQPQELKRKLDRLSDDGFTLGPDPSRLLHLKEGQRVYLSSRGNIELSNADNTAIRYTFYKYMNEINDEVKLRVKDIYLQRELPEYKGLLQLTIDNGNVFPNETIDFTINLPKIETPRGPREVHKIRFPYYLTCLSGYLSKCICEKQPENWQDIVSCFIDKTQLKSLIRVARRRVPEVDQIILCKNVLHDWIKQTTKQEDKRL